ncbi:hypothetical protein [Rubritalea tangerina]|uniref:Uncharacterized protein n=1 Tax=Rubritalea tangerina TaxID=430798 RepID=A0ABW4ZBK7_9BACT
MNYYVKRTLQILAILSSVVIAGIYIYIQTLPPPPRWTTEVGKAEILQEALDNGMATEATTSAGEKVYFIGSTKYMAPHSFEELHFSHMEGMNKHAKPGTGTTYIPNKKEFPDLTITIIPPSEATSKDTGKENQTATEQ